MKSILVILIFLSPFLLRSQVWDWGLGASVIYTPESFNFGGGGRALIMLDDDVVGLSPQFSYMPGLFSVKEWFAGGALQYNFTPYKKTGIYATLGAYYNQHDQNEKHRDLEKDWSLSFEPGIGFQRNEGCVRPFAEARYNTKWKEASAHVGFLFMYGDCFPKKYCSPSSNPMN